MAYHHHLMMVAETFDEVSRLFDATGREVGLLLDTGHADAGGFDYPKLIGRFGDRIVHIHLKDVRGDVMELLETLDIRAARLVDSHREAIIGVAEALRERRYLDAQEVDQVIVDTLKAHCA